MPSAGMYRLFRNKKFNVLIDSEDDPNEAAKNERMFFVHKQDSVCVDLWGDSVVDLHWGAEKSEFSKAILDLPNFVQVFLKRKVWVSSDLDDIPVMHEIPEKARLFDQALSLNKLKILDFSLCWSIQKQPYE